MWFFLCVLCAYVVQTQIKALINLIQTADILKGRKLTGYWNIQVDLKNADGTVLEQPVVTDGNLVTSRHPIDVADFSKAVEAWLIKNSAK